MPIIDFYLNAFFICFFILLGLIPVIIITKKPHLFDLFWGAGIATSAISVSRLYSNLTLSHTIVLTFVFLWGARLFCFLLYTRILTKHTDSRYALLNKSSLFKLVLKQLIFQSLLQAVMVFSVYPITHSISINKISLFFGGSIFCIALILQSIADYQLYKFKKTNKGICNVGLWGISRHPNYFFECLIWVGISTIFLPNIYFLISAIAPLSIFVITFYLTGPLTEKTSLNNHQSLFTEYQKSTPYFFPRIFKK